MVIKDKIKWIGKVNIIKIRNGKIIKDYTINNLITNLGLNEIIKSMYSIPNMTYKYVAIGDDNTPAAAGDTTLGNEIFRTPILTQTVTGTGQLTSRSVLLDTEPFDAVPPPPGYQCTISEIGFFAGSSALAWNGGAGIDTGTLIARLVLTTPEDKYDNEQIAITRIDSIERA